MPEITKTYQLKITVEQFLNASSNTELREVDFLLGRYLSPAKFENINSSFVEKLNSVLFPGEILASKERITLLADYHKNAFIEFLKSGYSLDAAFEVIEIIQEIESISSVSADEVVSLMKFFSRLEKVRLTSLVKKPQSLLLNPMESEKSDNV